MTVAIILLFETHDRLIIHLLHNQFCVDFNCFTCKYLRWSEGNVMLHQRFLCLTVNNVCVCVHVCAVCVYSRIHEITADFCFILSEVAH
jgi:hypothetical protein